MTDVSGITASNPFAPPAERGPSTAGSSVANELGADVFLQLLVAQLKYQDPTSPADGTEFLAQTAQFTMVEKLTQIAEQTEASAVVNRNLGAASLVGRQITWMSPDGTPGQGVVQSARLGSAGPVLTVDGRDVPFDMVSSVTQPAPATTSAPAPASPAPGTTPTTATTTAPVAPAPTPTSPDVTDDAGTTSDQPTATDGSTPA